MDRGSDASVQLYDAILGVKPSMHIEYLSCLDIRVIHLFLWPSYYTSGVSDQCRDIGVDGSGLFLTTSFLPDLISIWFSRVFLASREP